MKYLKAIIYTNLILLLFPFSVIAQHIELIKQNQVVSIRGLSVVDDKVAWISSSKGHVALSIDGGRSWDWQQIKGFEKSDFRDIEAFSDKEAVVMSSGTPALTLKTTDGGHTWKVNYRKDDSAYFLDAMDFDTPKHGFILGDPINDKFILIETNDGGGNWKTIAGPPAIKSQAAFAASGTCIISKDLLTIVTGGSDAEFLIRNETGWVKQLLPLLHGQSSQGAFSVASGKKTWVVVGGDYQNKKKRDSTACYSIDKGLTWHLAKGFPTGYQSCVEYIKADTFLSTGTSGTNISVDGGNNWTKLDDQSYNVCRKAKHGNLVILAGDSGKIGLLKL
ncbi:YCF48-related protein [Mucilaginibacter sp. dw_454]|uniref:WD40/YVTN/BNR-like repeat-containing protein n=1 Tax=Mucilaginibacter sp. dw_454 TaxID=2720079 RepID=UPI001BD2ABB5|nr:YCF48-related protein [Mucilaginibacter sp. dw_454]